MPTSGLVLTLANPDDAEQLARALQSHEPRLEFGDLQMDRLPCVLETAGADDSKAIHDWLLQQPGILEVHVAFVSFEEPTNGPSEQAHK